MSRARPALPVIMNRDAYRQWAAAQPRGRFERIAGEVVAMAPERVAHVRVKANVWRALDDAVRAAGLRCEALGDGVTVEVGEDTDYEPDAMVTCGDRTDGEAIAAANPVILVEVLSPSTRSVDTGAKLADYFTLPSVMHYLVVRADRPAIIHHRRQHDGTILTTLAADGVIDLDPPGFMIAVADIYRT